MEILLELVRWSEPVTQAGLATSNSLLGIPHRKAIAMRTSLLKTALLLATILCIVGLLGKQATSNPVGTDSAQAKGSKAELTALLTQRRDLLRQMEQTYLAQY